jgi:hypothetical protein
MFIVPLDEPGLFAFPSPNDAFGISNFPQVLPIQLRSSPCSKRIRTSRVLPRNARSLAGQNEP